MTLRKFIIVLAAVLFLSSSAHAAPPFLYGGIGKNPSFTSLTLTGLTASKPVGTDANKVLSSLATTGSGSVVLATSPSLVTPALGVATATSLNKLTLTQPATSATLTIIDGKTLTVELDSVVNQDLTTDASPTFASTTLSSLSASQPVITDGNKLLASVAYTGATSMRKSLGLETDDSPTFTGLTVSGLSASYIPKAGVGGALGNSLFYDTGSGITIGTESPDIDWGGGRFLQVTVTDSFGVVSVGSNNRVADTERIGAITFDALGNTNNYRTRAVIEMILSGSTANKHGGYLSFLTAADNTTNPTEKFRISPTGTFSFAANAGMTFASLGTATRAIDLSSTGLSGSSDYWIYNSANDYWSADGKINVPGLYATTSLQIPEGTPVNAVAAVGTITMSGVATADETFIISTQTFVWKAARTGAGEVTIGANAAEAVTNIVTAVTADLATVTAVDGAGDTVTVTATTKGVSGNSIPFTEASTNMAVDGADFLGGTVTGVDGTVALANEIKADATYLYHAIAANTIADTNWRRIALGSAY